MMDKLFGMPRNGEVVPTKEIIVPEKKVISAIERKRMLRNLPNTPVVFPRKSIKQVETYSRPTVEDPSLDLLTAAVIAHNLRFDPQPERFEGGGGTFGGAGASGSWEDNTIEETKSSYTPSSNDTSLSCGMDSSSSDSSSPSSSE